MSALHDIPRVRLAQLPTPLEEAPKLSAALGGPRILLKRDDLTGLALGGNKARKLEFLMADAVAQGADTVITTGAADSNHCRMTAAAAVRLRLRCVLLLGDLYPGSSHVHSEALGAASDGQIWGFARQNNFIVVTKDVDFYHRALRLGHPPKVIWLRLGNCSTADVEGALRRRYARLRAFESDSGESALILDWAEGDS